MALSCPAKIGGGRKIGKPVYNTLRVKILGFEVDPQNFDAKSTFKCLVSVVFDIRSYRGDCGIGCQRLQRSDGGGSDGQKTLMSSFFSAAFSRHLSFFTLFPPKANRINKTRSGREGGEDRLYSRCYDIITLQQVKIYGRRFILTPICRRRRRRRRRLRITYTYQSVFHHKKSRPSCYLWQFAFTHVHACKHALQYSTMIQ